MRKDSNLQKRRERYIDFTFKGQRIRESIGPSRKGAEAVIAKKKAGIAENKFLDVKKEPEPIKFYDFANIKEGRSCRACLITVRI